LGFGATVTGGGRQGTSNDITIDGVRIAPRTGNGELGINSLGNHWVIEHSTITGTGLSGLLLRGSGYRIADNTITNTGLDTRESFHQHGIYLDASDARIVGNVISIFSDSGISVRYRDTTIARNVISGGPLGIDFFQSDPLAGSNRWFSNTISDTTVAGIYVSPAGSGGNTKASFLITSNRLRPARGVNMNLSKTTGSYLVADNQCVPSHGPCTTPRL